MQAAKKIKSNVCTLFEGDYHYGVGALVNSLYKYDFRGIVWVGYKGNLPPWAINLRENEQYKEFDVADDLTIRFVFLDTNAHLTNIKPEFMLSVWDQCTPDITNLFYLDPDICIKCRWSFFEEWTSRGVALCEDVTSPFPSTHPIRLSWIEMAEGAGLQMKNVVTSYVNGGFVGISRANMEFLCVWQEIQNIMDRYIDGRDKWGVHDRTFPFHMTDQDALNIVLMYCDVKHSIIGKEGMDFAPGGYTMAHAAGGTKPWRKRFSRQALSGYAPTSADKQFLDNASGPIQLYSSAKLRKMKTDARIAAAFGRCIRRS